MTKLIRIPKHFYQDHADRDLPTPEVVRCTSRHLYVRSDDPALPELLNDAEYYSDPHGPWAGIGLRSSALATVRAIASATRVTRTC